MLLPSRHARHLQVGGKPVEAFSGGVALDTVVSECCGRTRDVHGPVIGADFIAGRRSEEQDRCGKEEDRTESKASNGTAFSPIGRRLRLRDGPARVGGLIHSTVSEELVCGGNGQSHLFAGFWHERR